MVYTVEGFCSQTFSHPVGTFCQSVPAALSQCNLGKEFKHALAIAPAHGYTVGKGLVNDPLLIPFHEIGEDIPCFYRVKAQVIAMLVELDDYRSPRLKTIVPQGYDGIVTRSSAA